MGEKAGKSVTEQQFVYIYITVVQLQIYIYNWNEYISNFTYMKFYIYQISIYIYPIIYIWFKFQVKATEKF